MLDLYIFPLHQLADPLQPAPPGLLAVPPLKPGKSGREGDLLVLYLSLSRPEALTTVAVKQMMENAVGQYHRGHGTLTAGLRSIAEQLNGILLERNLRGPQPGQPVLATINLAALRENVLYLAQSGPTHTFYVNPDYAQDYNDSLTGGRGLGHSSVLTVKYFQANIQAGDVLVFSPTPPDAWTPQSLSGASQITLEHLRRRLLSLSQPDTQAMVVKFQNGDGQIHLLRHRSAQAPQPPTPLAAPAKPEIAPSQPTAADLPIRSPGPAEKHPVPVIPIMPTVGEKPEPIAPLQVESVAPFPAPASEAPILETGEIPLTAESPKEQEQPAPSEPASPPAEAAATPTEPATGQPITRAERIRQARVRADAERQAKGLPPLQAASEKVPTAVPQQAPAPAPAPAKAKPARAQPKVSDQGRRRAASIWLGLKSFFQRVGSGWEKLTRRRPSAKIKPAKPPLSSAAMLFIAIAVPLVVVAVGSTLYFRTGRDEQRQAFFVKALEFAAQAVQQPDPVLQRNNWTQAQEWLDKAEEYGATDETRAVRLRIQQALDSSEGITRLEFKAINRYGFSSGVKITRMAASSSDIYLLDSSQGRVLRLFLTGTGYELDNQFRCSPGVSGNLQVGALVDLVVLPPNSRKATVLAIDSNATLLYCIPGDRSIAVQLTPPDSGWGKAVSMTLSQESLLLFDQLSNAVWRYSGKDATFANKPALFFDKVVPSLANVVDLTVYGDDLYLLHQDGSLTQCTASTVAFAPTRCKDPAKFGDTRPGRESAPIKFADAVFTQVSATQPPDPSIYLLDARGQGVYHFSLLLNFQHQFRPSLAGETKIPREAPTSFTITPTRLMVLAYGSQIFYAQMP